MTDTEKKIAEIREALEKATPGPWTKFENRIYGKAQPAVEPIICEFYEEETERDRNNAHLIANAPEWLGFLLDELDRLKREIESHGPEGRNYTNRQVVELRMERERLIEENRKLLEERDEARRKAEEAWKEIDSLERLREERDKLIEGLRIATDVLGTVPMNDARLWGVYNKLCDILKEVGVTVE